VIEGNSGVDEHLVTGESIPAEKRPGDNVIGGSLNQYGTLLVRVTKVGEESFLSQVARQVEEARALKPGLFALVDRILEVYVPGVVLFAAAALFIWTFGAWWATGTPDWTRAIFAALAVFVMGYPCALGMATPLAMIRGGGMAAERGILMRSGEAFQVLKDIRRIVLDKTGTLTEGRPSLREIVSFGEAEGELLAVAAAAEAASEHPLARAIVDAAFERGITPPDVEGFEAVPGKGVIARIGGTETLVGSPRFLAEHGISLEAHESRIGALEGEAYTVIAVARGGTCLGLLALGDSLRADARPAVVALRAAGVQPVLVTGDNERTARVIAGKLGIDAVHARILPGGKAEIVQQLQTRGRVAMVGDGINDAPALMQADVGIAIGAGTDIAIESADIVLVGHRLGAVVEAFSIGRLSYRKTVQNLALAFAFNGVGVPLAVTGLVHPVWAMIAMAASVTAVLTNSFAGRLLPGKKLRALRVISGEKYELGA